MKLSHVIMVMIFSAGMGIGQLLFKFAAQRQLINTDTRWFFRFISLCGDWSFLLGIVLYGLLLVYWVWLLTFIPLSRAYPFTLLGFIIVAAGGAVFFNEPLTLPLIVGLAIIGVGLVVLSAG